MELLFISWVVWCFDHIKLHEKAYKRCRNVPWNLLVFKIWFAAHGDKIHLRPWKFRFGCNLAYFGKIVAWNEKIDQKLPGFRVVGLGIIIFELSDEADLLVQLVPECWPMIAALSRSFFALMVRHETQLIFQSLWYLHPSLLTAKKNSYFTYYGKRKC